MILFLLLRFGVLSDNFEFSNQMASNYMRITENQQKVITANFQRAGNLSIREALRLITDDSPKTPPRSNFSPSRRRRAYQVTPLFTACFRHHGKLNLTLSREKTIESWKGR